MGKGAGGGGSGPVVLTARPDSPKFKINGCIENSVKRSFNFCAGPAMLDSDALVSIWKDFLSWQGSGVSLIEMSQRDKGGPVQTIISEATDNIRNLLKVPKNYRILLFQVC
jgi:phosphoserine aminotransferase